MVEVAGAWVAAPAFVDACAVCAVGATALRPAAAAMTIVEGAVVMFVPDPVAALALAACGVWLLLAACPSAQRPTGVAEPNSTPGEAVSGEQPNDSATKSDNTEQVAWLQRIGSDPCASGRKRGVLTA
jgi:hypothetical protein